MSTMTKRQLVEDELKFIGDLFLDMQKTPQCHSQSVATVHCVSKPRKMCQFTRI